jgi:AcrR family transcriptional regulator
MATVTRAHRAATPRKSVRKAREWATTPATRQRILDAALECFEANGVAATTIDDITTAAELSVGSVYHHFTGKDDIFEHLVRQALNDYRTGIVTALEGDRTVEQSLRRMVHFHIRWVEDRRALTRLMLQWEESQRDRPTGRDHYGEYSESIGHWLRKQAHDGTIRRMAPDLYSTLLMGPLMEHARQRTAGLTTASPTVMERGLVDGLTRLLTR